MIIGSAFDMGVQMKPSVDNQRWHDMRSLCDSHVDSRFDGWTC